MSRLLI